MRKLLAVFFAVVFLSGCSGEDQSLDKAMSMRARLLDSQGCSFRAVITADYGDKLYEFVMQCSTDSEGALSFTVTSPETIAGITGTISSGEGKLIFDDQALVFSLLADGQVTPVSAPWIFIKALRSGYLSACTKTENGLRLAVDDSYEEDALHLDIWTDETEIPIYCEILWQGRRVVSLDIKNFTYV